MSRKENKTIAEFIELYKSEPCLWKVKCSAYHDRTKKDAAYAILCEKLKEIEPNATKKSVLAKINSLRSAYRKERKRVQDSMRSGSSTDSIYKATLWYYDLMNFVHDQEIPRSSISNLDIEPLQVSYICVTYMFHQIL